MGTSETGWIKVSRRLLENPIADKPAYLAIWIHLLLRANHEETSFIWNGKKQILKRGQLLTGRKKLSKDTGVGESNTYKILKYLEMEQQIEQQKTTKYTVITIVNWDKYQEKEQQKEQQSNNRVTTEEQQSNTYKNVKNVKNDKNREVVVKEGNASKEVKPSNREILLKEETRQRLSVKLGVDLATVVMETEKMVDWLASKGKVYKDYEAFARNWLRRRGVENPSVVVSNLLNTSNGK